MTPLGILAATLEGLCERIEGSDRIDDAFRVELRSACALASGLDPYVGACTTPESPALAAIAARTAAEDWSRAPGNASLYLEQEMLSGHVEGQTLKFLVQMTGATQVLEIGMFTGYSALAMAEALPGSGRVVACEVDGYVAGIAQRCFDEAVDGSKIVVRVGPALETLESLAAAGESFDLVFIDADKAGYRDYLETILDRDLLVPGGLICVDNTLMQGLPYTGGESTPNGEAITAFNRAVAEDPRVVQVLLPVRDGLTLIRRA